MIQPPSALFVYMHKKDREKCGEHCGTQEDKNIIRSRGSHKGHQVRNNQEHDILKEKNYIIVCCSILKEPYIRQYGRLNDVYGLSLSYIMERSVFYLDSLQNNNIQLTTIVECRGKKEDKALLDYYNRVCDIGTYWVSSTRLKNYFREFELRRKSDDLVGLQIADLIAYPITRHVLDENAVNFSFDIIKGNIYQNEGKIYGMKVFPNKKESPL